MLYEITYLNFFYSLKGLNIRDNLTILNYLEIKACKQGNCF
jgi:hypothetical protein